MRLWAILKKMCQITHGISKVSACESMNKIFLWFSLPVFAIFLIVSQAEPAKTRFSFINSIHEFSKEYPFLSPSALFVDGEELYVADRAGRQICVFDLDGNPIFQFGKEKGLGQPFDFFVFEDRIHVSQIGKSSIEIFNIRGDRIGTVNPPFEGFIPGRMAMIDGGGFFVVDRVTLKICAFDNEGKYLYNFGGRNVFKSMMGITTKKDKVYVTVMDSYPVVRVFDLRGNYLTGFGRIGESKQLFSMPSGIKVDDQGIIWVADLFKHKLSAFNEEGQYLAEYAGLTSLHYPLDFDFSGGLFFVLEKERKRIVVYKREYY